MGRMPSNTGRQTLSSCAITCSERDDRGAAVGVYKARRLSRSRVATVRDDAVSPKRLTGLCSGIFGSAIVAYAMAFASNADRGERVNVNNTIVACRRLKARASRPIRDPRSPSRGRTFLGLRVGWGSPCGFLEVLLCASFAGRRRSRA